MNAKYEIYADYEDRIPAEDKARFDGYMKGRDDFRKMALRASADNSALKARIKALERGR